MKTKNPFTENHEAITLICEHENVNYFVATSMFVANASNFSAGLPMYGGEDVAVMADWDALNVLFKESPPVLMANWSAEYSKFIKE